MDVIIENKTAISKQELNAILNSRITVDYTGTEKTVSYKEINEPIILDRILNPNSNVHIKPLNFNNCLFNKEVNIGDYQRAGRVLFESCIFCENSIIDTGNSKLKGTCEFRKDLTITLSKHGDESIEHLNIKNTLTINGSTNALTVFAINYNQHIQDQKIIFNANCTMLSFQNVFSKEIEIRNNAKFTQGSEFVGLNTKKMTFRSISLGASFYIGESQIEELDIFKVEGNNHLINISSNNNIKNIYLPLDSNFDAYISNCTIDEITLSGSNRKENVLSIEKSFINNLVFANVINNGLIMLKELNIYKGGMVSFRSSNLGKTDFIYCNFSKAILEFENSKITEAFFSETEFPKTSLLEGKKNFAQAQLAFGQLATAFQKQGDTVRSLEYHSREIEAHYNGVHWISKDFFKKFNLWLNYISNNFGRWWILGVIFTFGVGLLFFCCLLFSTGKYQLGAPSIDLSLLSSYLKFMNPLRFIDTESLFSNKSNVLLNKWSYLWDFLGRVFVAFGYYQTIQAFRRFGRK